MTLVATWWSIQNPSQEVKTHVNFKDFDYFLGLSTSVLGYWWETSNIKQLSLLEELEIGP